MPDPNSTYEQYNIPPEIQLQEDVEENAEDNIPENLGNIEENMNVGENSVTDSENTSGLEEDYCNCGDIVMSYFHEDGTKEQG